MEALKEMRKRHSREYGDLQSTCGHFNSKIYERTVGFRHREITIICEDCGTPLVGFCCRGEKGYVQYARGFQKLPKDIPPLLTEAEADGLDGQGLLEFQRKADIKFYAGTI